MNRKKPVNLYDMNKLHVKLIKSIAPILKKPTRKKINAEKIMVYEYDNEVINEARELYNFMN